MLAIERQEQIVSQIRRNGAVRIHELTKQFSVSVETIRRDLLELERQDCLHRVHGGAVGIAVAKQYHRLEERTEENPQKKEELSGYAAGLIREGDVLMVDSGSTAIAFAKMLAEEFERLTVITYSLQVFEILKKKEGFTPYLCAGAYLRDENAFCGQWALQMLEQFHAKTAFLFPSAISLQNGIMDYDQELYHLQRAMMKHADRSVFLADSDKFEKSALLKLADVNEAVTFVTDSGLRKEILELYQENRSSETTGSSGGKNINRILCCCIFCQLHYTDQLRHSASGNCQFRRNHENVSIHGGNRKLRDLWYRTIDQRMARRPDQAALSDVYRTDGLCRYECLCSTVFKTGRDACFLVYQRFCPGTDVASDGSAFVRLS